MTLFADTLRETTKANRNQIMSQWFEQHEASLKQYMIDVAISGSNEFYLDQYPAFKESRYQEKLAIYIADKLGLKYQNLHGRFVVSWLNF